MNKLKRKHVITRRSAIKAAVGAVAGLTIAYVFGRNLIPVLPSLDTPDFDDGTAWISVSKDGGVSMFCPIQEMGQGSSLSMAQIVAEELNIDASAITVRFPSTNEVPNLRFTTGSLGVVLHAKPVAEAAARLREELRRRAAIIANDDPNTLIDADGGFVAPNGKYFSYKEAVTGADIVLEANALAASKVYTFDATRNHRQVGQTGLQVQAREIVTGLPVFGADIRRPGTVYGRAIQAPAPNAQIISVDDGGAASLPGVLAVVENRELNLVGVVAETPSQLNAAIGQMTVNWDRPNPFGAQDIDALMDIDKALKAGALEHALHDDELNADTPWSIDLRFDQPALHHACQEPRTAIAEFSTKNGREEVDIWTGTQDAFVNQKKAAADLGWSPDRVTLHSMRIGGGFGGRVLYDVVREALFLARAVERPVKVEWSRSDEFLADRMRPPSSHRIRANFDEEGRISDWWHACQSGYVLLTEMVAPEPTLSVARYFLHDRGSARGLQMPYLANRKRIELSEVELPFHVGEWRSLGAAPNNFAIESAIDDIARQLKQDPVDFRLLNLGAEHERLKQCLHQLKKLTDNHPHKQIKGFGRGIACGIYDENTYVAAAFDVHVDLSEQMAKIERCYCVIDAGLAISPDQIRGQIEGSAMMAIGQLLSETVPFSEQGLSASRFSDYPMATIEHSPVFEIEIITQREVAPAGVGQAPIVALVPALANSFKDATGYRLNTLPIDFDAIS